MVRQVSSKLAPDSQQPSVRLHLPIKPSDVRWLLLVSAIIVVLLPDLKAESLESKNKEGNRLFIQGRYEDAEKAYLEAQGISPGRPEILFNLGNSLIKQKKYNQGIQSLRQSISKGDKGIKESSWYNTGNALFLMGRFKDSAEAYVQALRMNPADSDAKHNLELALMKLKQQVSKQSSANPKGQKTPNQDQSQKNKEGQPQGKPDPNNSGNRKEQREPAKLQAPQTEQREGSISREQALQLLDALQSRELEDQRKEHRAKQRLNERDW